MELYEKILERKFFPYMVLEQLPGVRGLQSSDASTVSIYSPQLGVSRDNPSLTSSEFFLCRSQFFLVVKNLVIVITPSSSSPFPLNFQLPSPQVR
jgi:hypothetical protein